MAAKNTLEVIESILGEGDLMRIWEELNIPASIVLELPGPSKRVTMGLATQVALYEEAFSIRLRLLLLIVLIELLRWYHVCPT